MPALKINQFYDVNMFPKGYGILVFGISIPYISSRQSPLECFKADLHQIQKIRESGVGNCVVYSDGLYQYSNEPAAQLKVKFQRLLEEHKRGYLKLIKKKIEVVPSAFSFSTWGQLLLEIDDLSKYLCAIRNCYMADQRFQSYVAQDILQAGRKVEENTVSYILEEVLVDFLVAKGRARLRNDYVQDRQRWILNCYHGKPHRAHVYFYQQNPLKISLASNCYQNSWYDMSNFKLYDFERFDIDKFDFSAVAQIENNEIASKCA